MTQKIEVNQEIENAAPDENALPGKLSDLVLLALDDANKLNRDLYSPTRKLWHEPGFYTGSDKCFVCLAGMVIAGRLKGNIELTLSPQQFDYETSQKLDALNAFRLGDFEGALECTGQIDSEGEGSFDDDYRRYLRGIESYEEDLDTVATLRAHGKTVRMLGYSNFFSWAEFDDFADHAREVVELLVDAGF